MAAVFVAGLAACAASLFMEQVVDMKTLSYLQAAAGVLGVGSKLPQILAVWQEGGTGQLSAFAVSLLCSTHAFHFLRSAAHESTSGLQLPRGLAVANLHHFTGG